MDPDPYTTNIFKWDPRNILPPAPSTLNRPPPLLDYTVAPPPSSALQVRREVGGLDHLFQAYGIRYYTAAKISELGFTVSTLVNMKDEELEEMMNGLSQIFRWDLLVGERYGIKAAVRAERRRMEEEETRRRNIQSADTTTNTLDALSQEGLSEEPVVQLVQEKEAGGSTWEMERKKRREQRRMKRNEDEDEEEDEDEAEAEEEAGNNNKKGKNKNKGGGERQREHPFIVTEPGEVARGKKNGLDYLFHLYEQCREFLIQVQNMAKERGDKCPTKVTNQVFRYAKKAGASYINKPKMRHYVHCYALHCLDEEASNELRIRLKERGENVGAWRQACYKPLVAIAARQGWDIDAIFNAHPRLSIWYVPTKLRQLCHAQRNAAAPTGSPLTPHFPF